MSRGHIHMLIKLYKRNEKKSDFVELYEKIKDLVPFNRWTPLLYAFKQDKMQESNIKLHLAKWLLFDPLIYKEQYRAHKKKIKYTNKKLCGL